MDDYKYLDCCAGKIENDKLYVVSVLLGIVLEYDLKNFTYTVLTQINLPDLSQRVRVNSIIKVNHLLYMTLSNSWNVFEYDIKNKRLKVYGNNFEYIDGKEVIVKSHLYQERIWLFPYDVSQKIKSFHIKTKKFEDSTSVEEIINQKGYRIRKGSLLCLDVFQEKYKCIIAVYDSPYIIEMNLDTEKYSVYEVKSNAKIEIVSYADGQYWISYIDSKIIERWSPEHGILEAYEPQKISMEGEWKYRYIFSYKEKVIIIPTKEKGICIIDKRTGQETLLEYSETIRRVHNMERWMFYEFVKYKDKIILLPFSMTHFIVLELQNERLEIFHSKFGLDVINEYWRKPRLLGNSLYENNTFELSEYQGIILEYNSDMKDEDGRVGEKIWMWLK